MLKKTNLKKLIPVLLLTIIFTGILPTIPSGNPDTGISVYSDFDEEYIILD